MQELKQFFIDNGIAIDNEYLDKYLYLIEQNKDNKKIKFVTDAHHVVPRYYYNYSGLKVDDSDKNLINLTRADHMLAHLYLAKCSTEEFLYPSNVAIFIFFSRYNNGVKTNIEDFIQEHSEEINEQKEIFCKLQSERVKSNPIQLSEEAKKIKSEKIKKAKQLNNNSGKKGICFEDTYMFVPEEELDIWLQKGAKLGRWQNTEESKQKNRETHLGKKLLHTDEWNQHISEATKGRIITEKQRDQIRETLLKNYPHGQIQGKIAVSNIEENIVKMILPEELEQFIANGYIRGNIHNKGFNYEMTTEILEKISSRTKEAVNKPEVKQKQSMAQKGKHWYHNDSLMKNTKSNECPDGWKPGRINYNKKKSYNDK